jgi:large subunit ribosomal protein LX
MSINYPSVPDKVTAGVVTKMKNFVVKGKFKAGINWENFTKKVESQNEKNATDKVYSVFGSKHGIKRSQIQIESIAEE